MTPIAQLLGGSQQPSAPKTPNELAAMIERRDELQNQLEQLNENREDLAQQIERLGSTSELRQGPMARLRATDDEINRVTADIAKSNELIAAAKARGITADDATPEVIRIPTFEFGTQTPPPWRERVLDSIETTGPIAFATVVLLGTVMYWWISRSVRGQLTKLIAMQSARLEELQRSVDTVAVEVERVSENQRYVTKLVGDKPPAH